MRAIESPRLSRLVSSVLAAALLVVAAGGLSAQTPGWTLVGWNNLGMHCMDADYSVFSLLPPFNTIHAQLIDPQGHLVTDPGAITVTYEAVADPDGSLNTTAAGKTNFWEHVLPLFGVSLPVDTGLLFGQRMPGTANVPQPMVFDAASAWFIAAGIPITPYDDDGVKNPYPLMRLVARAADGSVLATTDIVLPVSDEMTCKGCHASGVGLDGAKPMGGWVNEADAERDFRLNVLRLHDERRLGDPTFAAALAARAFSSAGLEATVRGGNAILCASCHLSEALPGSGLAGIPPLTQSIHAQHSFLDAESSGREACYKCHPGSVTRCLRGVMGAAVSADGGLAIQCQSCHGAMAAVASPSRTGWLNEPSCQQCHTGTAVQNNGQIRYLTVFGPSGAPRVPVNLTFATNADTPAAGLDLYRFSAGHGGVKCEACHGSTHAEFPAAHRNDNIQSIGHQGHVGMLSECTVCHATQPNTVSGGPHGMHPLGAAWVSGHGNAVEGGGSSQCRSCHGTDYRGTVLSRSQADRILSTDFGSKHFWRGFQIGCYTCHNGPSSENGNPNHAAVVQSAAYGTPVDVPLAVTLGASDADGNPLTLRIVAQPQHGTVGLTNRAATYFPEAGYLGGDSFTFAAWDGATDSNLGVISIDVGGSGATPTPTPAAPGTPTPTMRPAVCNGGVAIGMPILRVVHNLAPSGDERLTLKGEMILADANIDPVSSGFGFRVSGPGGAMVFERQVPPGASTTAHAPGWRVNAAATRWTFVDPDRALAPGVRLVTLRRAADGRLVFRVSAPRGAFAIAANELPAVVDVVVGPRPGQCGRVAFNPAAGSPPHCSLTAMGDKLICR